MATAIFFNGRRINVPGAYSKIDASRLASVSPSTVGVVALIGEAEGGKPLTVEPEHSDHTRPGTLLTRYRSGDLRIAGQFAFDPANDENVPGGAQRLVAVKVNPSTQSTATLPDGSAADSIVLTSRDYGLFTTQINVLVEAGTVQGKKITVTFEDVAEVFDDIGGDAILDVIYAPGSDGYDSVTGQITATHFTTSASKAETGLVAERTADVPANTAVEVLSSDAGDTTQTITIYGLNAANAPVSETLVLNGTTVVEGVQVFSTVLGVRKSAATTGSVTVRTADGVTTLFTLAAGTLTRGLVLPTNTPVSGVVTVASSAPAAGANVVVRGLSPTGAAIAERFDMSASPVVGATAFSKITQIELGDIPGGTTITITCKAAETSHSAYKTVQRVVDYLNGLDGFTANALIGNATTFLMADADYAAAASLVGAARSFYADLYAFAEALNDGSAYVTAARAAGATAVPANTASAVYLAGGTEGATTITQWQQAFDLLKKRRVNIIVPLTRDPAVHALLLTHLKERAGRLRSEANGYVGLGTAGGAGETRANIKSQIVAIQSRHVGAVAQEVQRYHPDTGEATWFPPHYHAVIAAGAQAGSPIGEPLTRKLMNVLDVRNDSSWSVVDDVEEMIDAGLIVAENVEGSGVRWVRSVTTHLADDNVVFVEVSANEAADRAVFELRRRLDLKVGKRGLSGSAATIKGLAAGVLGELQTDEILVQWRALQVEQIGDVFPVSVEIAPVLPINFIPITVHLIAVRVAA